ncbi:MAG: methylmalonyl-CoA mutase family protein [Bdellovibrionales bacterium]|nr:methylmalonyl-CoA mutase family protein [Bdellovibrionales bacterium]
MSSSPIKTPVRFITAASLFDGHDASINIIRRILQDQGAEVIHLGHNRSVRDVVVAALQEGAQGIAISSYQGGHMEYFKYMKDLLKEAGAPYVKIYGGGGGVIVHEEKAELEKYGIAQIFHPDDGRRLGLEGMARTMMEGANFSLSSVADLSLVTQSEYSDYNEIEKHDPIPHWELGLALSALEESLSGAPKGLVDLTSLERFKRKSGGTPPVLGITGTGGAGKSSLIDELAQRFLNCHPGIKIGIICVDPTKQKTGGALLGDRIRMNSLSRPGTFMRSVASRGSGNEIARSLPVFLDFLKKYDFDLLIAESSGIGQASTAITQVADASLYVMTSEFGAPSQLEKIDMIDYADLIAINKADHRGSQDALRDVEKQFRRSRKKFDQEENLPIYLTQASNFNDEGVNTLFFGINEVLKRKNKEGKSWSLPSSSTTELRGVQKQTIVPSDRQNYLAEIVSKIRSYKKRTKEVSSKASQLGSLFRLQEFFSKDKFEACRQDFESGFHSDELALLKSWDQLEKVYSGTDLVYTVRDQQTRQPLTRKSLSGLPIPRVIFPEITDWGDRFKFLREEHLPGYFPYTAGVFPLKREGEDPIRQFAGEGSPLRTNRRFHFLSKDSEVKRLSTAFDSVTLYGQDPDLRPDIFGKVGESGVSVASLEDMKKLYAGFDLCDPKTSVSMTINGPAPMILAFFFNTAIDQQIEKHEKELMRKLTKEEHQSISDATLRTVRGTVQADILKEDQGQNTCIFSIDFALKMMGDIQQFFVDKDVRNFYSVSISGYHIAEAGANPITQLALTLSNAFTYVEYYLSRGMKIDDFASSLSFFFSNGLDAEYTVIGRVARRIWSVAMRDVYQGNERSQKLKYHIQTSGRSLHAQEIDFNDIRTTLQALLAINDNCNSLHTNAYDEAITTPTEESVRRAQAIQMIINYEYGLSKNENPSQGSYFIKWLTDEVEEAVLAEFLRINERGGVLGAMETQYQRSKIQEESLHYEHLKHSGQLPIIGVNTFIDSKTLDESYSPPPIKMARATREEKLSQLDEVESFKNINHDRVEVALRELRETALCGGNIFVALMSAARCCSLYQMSQALFEVGGQYRRNI